MMDILLQDGSFTVGKEHPQRVLNFLNDLGKGPTSQNRAGVLGVLENKSDGRMETEISGLKEAIKKLEAEKEAGLAQFYKLLKKASYLESRVLSAEEESRMLKEQASNYDADKISSLQTKLLEAEDHARRVGERACEAEDEIERLKNEVAKLEEEREHEVSLVLEKLGSMEELIDERLSLEIEKNVMIDFVEGVAYDADHLLRKNVFLEMEKEFLISQMKELRDLVEGLKHELGQTLDDNEVLVLENSVLLWLFGEFKMEAAEAEEDKKYLRENFNEASRKVLELKTEAENLLRQKKDERNNHEEKLKMELEDKNEEFSELQKSYQNLQTHMAKVVQENRILRKDSWELKQQNLALYEDLMHQSKSQLHEVEVLNYGKKVQNQKLHQENSVEVRNYGKKVLSLDEQKFSEAVDVELLKENAKQDRIVNLEKAVDYTMKFSTLDDFDNEIKCDVPKTLAEELSCQCSCILNDRSVCTIKHMTPHKSHIGLKMAAPLWGLKIGNSTSKASSVNSDGQKDTTLDQTSKHPCNETSELEKKHRGRISDIGKKLHLKSYLPRSKSITRQGEQHSKNKGFWTWTRSPAREDTHSTR